MKVKKFRKKELDLILEHCIYREYPQFLNSGTFEERVLLMLEEASIRHANLTAQWLRVGYNQGNYNSDNCMIGGRTLDYGPFGFIEKFDPDWCMWTNGGKHYSFMNQPIAGSMNFQSLISAIIPVFHENEKMVNKLNEIVTKNMEIAIRSANYIWATKLGFNSDDVDDEVILLITQILKIMHSMEADFTLFWRELSNIPEKFSLSFENAIEPNVTINIIDLTFNNCFYKSCGFSTQEESLITWMKSWLNKLISKKKNGQETSLKMKQVNPKFIPREWMLVEAYNSAINGDYTLVKELQALFQNPYEEQTEELSIKYYRKAPNEVIGKAGTAFMT